MSPDEACPNYEDIITNMYFGHNFVKKEFGITSKIGFQLDSLGHSSAHAALLVDFGFDALFVSRIDEFTKDDLHKTESNHFLWRPLSKHFGNQKQILTLVTPEGYMPPEGFRFDSTHTDDTTI